VPSDPQELAACDERRQSAIVSAAVNDENSAEDQVPDRLNSVDIECEETLAGLPSSFVTVASAPFVSGS